MTLKEFDNLKVGDLVYDKNGSSSEVTKINRTTKRVSAIGLGNNIFWRFLRRQKPKGSTSGSIMGICGSYDVVEIMEFKK